MIPRLEGLESFRPFLEQIMRASRYAKSLLFAWVPLFFFFVLLPIGGPCAAQEAPTVLLDHLAGDWVLKGTLGGKQSTHDIHADWILNHEYLRLHEVSREKKANGDPAYEAIVLISWEPKTQEYTCLWLDNTAGGGLSVPVARAKREEHAIPFVWVFSPIHSLHTTFTYDNRSDTWNWTIDDVTDGKPDRFANVTLTRRH